MDSDNLDLRLICPFTSIIVGPTGCGKTELTKKLLYYRDIVMRNPPQRIVWCYGVWQSIYEQMPHIEFIRGIPSAELLEQGNFILIVDDLMQETASSENLVNVFTKLSHHNNISCIYILQNLFPRGAKSRHISLNAHYIFLMKNSRDRAQISYLARQAFPGYSHFLTDAYADATKEPYSYLMLDFNILTPEHLRVRTGIFPDEKPIVYQYNT